ncbi:hypothetical protein RIF29_30169 [Crotalaria pallida]|uniref:Uncharacterized protein n=1 Tax=Crotalaria pallida TaxID=3830 RepID=A0AAN9EI76_CROPI
MNPPSSSGQASSSSSSSPIVVSSFRPSPFSHHQFLSLIVISLKPSMPPLLPSSLHLEFAITTAAVFSRSS